MNDATLCHIMETIKINSIVASYFSINKKKTEINFKTLSKFKKGLENKFRKKNTPAYIQYYRNNLIDLTQRYSESFKVDFDSKKIKYFNDKNNVYLINLVPFKIKDEYLKLFLEVNSEINSKD